MIHSPPIHTIMSSFPRSIHFYDLGKVELDQIVVDESIRSNLEHKQVIAFQIHGDFHGWFFVLADALLEGSTISELGNCLASGFASQIADELTEISPPIYPTEKQLKRILSSRSIMMRAQYFAYWKNTMIPVEVWVTGILNEGGVRV
jgi:hypothetical protein